MNNTVLKKTIFNVIGLVGFAALSSFSQAASFDCAKASTSIEKIICSDENASRTDMELSNAYKSALNISKNKAALKQQQRKWLKEVRNSCKDVECLIKTNQSRTSELIAYAYERRDKSLDDRLAQIKEKMRIENKKLPLSFKLVSGDSYPLCQPYVDMLNKTKYMNYPSCERKLLPEFKQFQAVEWTEVTDKKEIEKVLYEGLALQEARYDRLNTAMHERAWKLVKEDIDYGNYHLYFYQFDFDKDGDSEIIYKKTLPNPRGPESYRCNVLSIYSVFDKKITIENTVKYSVDKYQMIRSEGQLFVFDGKVINSIWQPIGDESSIELWTSNSRPSLCKINVQ